MNFRRIGAMVLQEWYNTTHSLEVVSDLFMINVVSLLVFGLFGHYVTELGSAEAGQVIILGFMLWECFQVTQYTVSVSTMWNIWSRNLVNIFITPITTTEYIVSQLLSGLLKVSAVFILLALVARSFLDFDIFVIPLVSLLPIIAILVISGWALGVAILGFIFAFGTRYQAITWNFIFLFQPITAALYPLDILPAPIQALAVYLPPTYAFEAARAVLVGSDATDLIRAGLILSVLWLFGGVAIFLALFRRSKMTGQFAHNE